MLMLTRKSRLGSVAPEVATLSQERPAVAVAPPTTSDGAEAARVVAPLLRGRDGVRLSFQVPTMTHRRLKLAGVRGGKTLAGVIEQLVGEHLPAI